MRRLFAESSIYWHASGFGEDEQRTPERFEHFGITVVEALAAGAVPIVYGAGGPAEIVQDGVHGYHWHDLDELMALTRRVATDVAERGRLSAAAEQRAPRLLHGPVRRRGADAAALTHPFSRALPALEE